MNTVIDIKTRKPFEGKAEAPAACQDCKKCPYKAALVKLLSLAMTTLQGLPEGEDEHSPR